MEHGVKPNLSKLRVFGSRVLCKMPGKRSAKLDYHVYKGIFVSYGATDKHIRYVDSVTSRDKIATHAIFDEAHYTSKIRPPGPQLLYSLGLPKEKETKQQTIMCTMKEVYPSLSDKPLQTNPKAAQMPLPLTEYGTKNTIAAKAAKVETL